MRFKSEVETAVINLQLIATIMIPLYILHRFNFITLLLSSLLIVSKCLWDAGENSVQLVTPRKQKTRKPGRNISNWFAKKNLTHNSDYLGNVGENPVQPVTPRKNRRRPGKGISNWFAKQKDSLTENGATCHEIRGHTIDRLYVSNEEIAKGGNGTVVLKGVYGGREVAVKRFPSSIGNVALRQIQHLVESDEHPNIVRFHSVKPDKEYVYVVLELCFCSLSDLVSSSANSQDECGKDFILWKSNGYPEPLLLKLMREMVDGLVHLHELGIIHGDITPQNVMIAKGMGLCAKLSEIGISKHLISSKNATNTSRLKQKHQRWPADMLSLGYVFYFCLSRGGHPSSDHLQDGINIRNSAMSLQLVYHIPEAVDLLSRLLHSNPKRRPKAKQVLHHPLFWDSEKRLYFLRDVSDRLQREKRGSKLLGALKGVGLQVFGARWDKKMDPVLVKYISRRRNYQGKSAIDLLRVVRNLSNHYHETPKGIQELLGSLPEGLDDYFSCRFPKLLMEVYKVVIGHCRSEKTFERYFGVNPVPNV